MRNKNTDFDKRLYELNYLVPLRDSAKIAEIAKKINDFVEKQAGVLIETEKADTPEATGGKSTVWVEKKRLAYPIRNDKGGYYLNSWFKIEPACLDDLRRFLKLEKEIIRYEILTETNIASAKPTKESVKLVDIDKLAAKSFDSPSDSRPRYQEKPRKEVLKPEVTAGMDEIIQKVPEKTPEVMERPSIVKAETPKAPVEVKEVKAMVPKVKPEKPKKEISKAAKEEESKAKEAAVIPEIEISEEKVEIKPQEEQKAPEPAETEKKDDGKAEKLKKPKKISLEDLDKRLDDILNEEIL
jgi:ribosomal protein S6